MATVIERFLNYISFDTQSAEEQNQVPSTEKQFRLAEYLADELKNLGAKDVELTDHCYVYATIPATTDKKVSVIGFIAHMDTAPAYSGKDVRPRIVANYDGGDIILNAEKNILLSPSEFAELSGYIGKSLIVTDGTTLLGADDKAGIAEIMTMAEELLTHPEIPHGEIRIGFTPDEEVGHGVDLFDVERFGAEYAYTLDGMALGELEYENFNAAYGKVKVHGISQHPGTSKNKMRNAMLIAMEFQSMLPVFQNPMCTERYEGFFHLVNIKGDVEFTEMNYIIRDHDMNKFSAKKQYFENCGKLLNEKYSNDTVEIVIEDNYYNMKPMIEPHMHIIENAEQAMIELGIKPIMEPIRGGTDGARLSYMGLPCPNLGIGSHNGHGKHEYAVVEDMETAVKLLLKIAEIR